MIAEGTALRLLPDPGGRPGLAGAWRLAWPPSGLALAAGLPSLAASLPSVATRGSRTPGEESPGHGEAPDPPRAGEASSPPPHDGAPDPLAREAPDSGGRAVKPVWVGCSGWNYPDWRERVYPAGLPPRRWLERYSELFETVEVNSTFYRLASPGAVAVWLEQTPPRFVFSVKASRFLTHMKRLGDIDQGIVRFYDGIRPLVESGRLGPVVWQLPETFRRDDERLASALDRFPPGRHCLEFRHASWFAPDVYSLLRERGAALVIGDHPARPFQAQERTADWTFVRFHFGRRGRDGNYSETELEEWRRRLQAWRATTEVFAYFNNDWRGFAVRNARWLKRRLEAGDPGHGD
ncbi:MAG: DUF72 domain-containing protein [Actinomycetota bacterium]|nr:DUF72 domain-containing protein [Actinomycetota bacterium]